MEILNNQKTIKAKEKERKKKFLTPQRRKEVSPSFVPGLPDFTWQNIPKREKYTK
jgi:hypothetical protein